VALIFVCSCRFVHHQDPLAHRNLARLLDATGNTRDSLTHNRIAVRLGPGHLTEGRVRDAHDTDTYRTVARQTVARNECVVIFFSQTFLFLTCISSVKNVRRGSLPVSHCLLPERFVP